MPWSTIIAEAGGGLSALVIIALAYIAYVERRRNTELIDRLLDRERQHSVELIETIKVVETVTRAIEGRM